MTETSEEIMNDRFDELRQQYGCGPVQFYGADEAL